MQVSCRCSLGGRAAVYELAEVVRYCCAAMRCEWGVLLGFGVNCRSRTTSRDVNVYGLHVFSTGRVIPAVTAIRFCPWCGEEIEVVGGP